MLQSCLFKITDHRRKQGRRYELGHILLLTILAILSGADSYRKVQKFIEVHYETFNEQFDLNWKRIPAYTTIRAIIQETSGPELEHSFRDYSQLLAEGDTAKTFISYDGKVVRGSFDRFQDQKAVQILSVFTSPGQLILAHEEIARKTNEIPTAQKLMQTLGLSGYIFTFDALHCQKKRCKRLKKPVMRPWFRSKATKKACSEPVKPWPRPSLPMKCIKNPLPKPTSG